MSRAPLPSAYRQPPIVVDFGAAYVKCGFANEAAPRRIFRSVYQLPAYHDFKRTFPLQISPQTTMVEIVGLEDWIVILQPIFRDIFFSHLLINPTERRVVVVQTPGWPRHFERAIIACLTSLNVPAFAFVNAATMPLYTMPVAKPVTSFPPSSSSSSSSPSASSYSSDVSATSSSVPTLATTNGSCIVIDIGKYETRLTPVCHGAPLHHLTVFVPTGSHHMSVLLRERILTALRTTASSSSSPSDLPSLLVDPHPSSSSTSSSSSSTSSPSLNLSSRDTLAGCFTVDHAEAVITRFFKLRIEKAFLLGSISSSSSSSSSSSASTDVFTAALSPSYPSSSSSQSSNATASSLPMLLTVPHTMLLDSADALFGVGVAAGNKPDDDRQHDATSSPSSSSSSPQSSDADAAYLFADGPSIADSLLSLLDSMEVSVRGLCGRSIVIVGGAAVALYDNPPSQASLAYPAFADTHAAGDAHSSSSTSSSSSSHRASGDDRATGDGDDDGDNDGDNDDDSRHAVLARIPISPITPRFSAWLRHSLSSSTSIFSPATRKRVLPTLSRALFTFTPGPTWTATWTGASMVASVEASPIVQYVALGSGSSSSPSTASSLTSSSPPVAKATT